MVKKRGTFIFLFFILGILLPAVFALTTLRAQETELVQLQPKSIDPDQDAVTYGYSAPFDEQGEWQTGYDDAGEYDVTITASDGVQESKEHVKVIIEKKNRPPVLLEKKISVKETQVADIKKLVQDPDGDEITFTFPSPFDTQGIWKTSYSDEGSHSITFTASDGEFDQQLTLPVEVQHTNQPPSVQESFSQEKNLFLKEDDTLDFFVDAEDFDGEQVLYHWTFDGQLLSEEKSGERHFSYDEAGKHTLSLVLSDGEKETRQEWSIDVKNTNRKPEVQLLPMIVSEGETVIFDLPEIDADGDLLHYQFPPFFTADGTWKTNYQDAGKHTLSILAFDGELQGEGILDLTVLDVDRAPEMNFPQKIWAKEGETVAWKMEVFDPDNDTLEFRFEDLPTGAVFDVQNKTLSWTPSYDLIHRSGGRVSNLLNTFRLEHLLLKQREIPLAVVVCGKELCSTSSIQFIVENTNRPPIFNFLPKGETTATATLQVDASATDPDGDEVHYYFTDPLDMHKGTWKTNYQDVGMHTAYVTATDGKQGTTLSAPLTVLKNNRLPKLKLSDEDVRVDELQELTLQVSAMDKDDDPVTLTIENLPPDASFKEGVFVWKPALTTVASVLNAEERSVKKQKETIWLRFTASDGEANVTAPVKVVVRNVNQPPEIVDYLPVDEKEVVLGQPTVFHFVAKDADGDHLTYHWDFGFGEKSVKGTTTVERIFTSAGRKKVRVTVSDGQEEVEKEFSVLVKKPEVQAVALQEKQHMPQQPRKSDDFLVASTLLQQPFTIGVYVVEG